MTRHFPAALPSSLREKKAAGGFHVVWGANTFRVCLFSFWTLSVCRPACGKRKAHDACMLKARLLLPFCCCCCWWWFLLRTYEFLPVHFPRVVFYPLSSPQPFHFAFFRFVCFLLLFLLIFICFENSRLTRSHRARLRAVRPVTYICFV